MELARNVIEAAPCHVGKDRGAIDKDIGIPDGRHAIVGVSRDMDPSFAVRRGIVDRLHALGLGEREEGPLHHLALVAQRHVRDVGQEQFKLIVDRGLGCSGHDSAVPVRISRGGRARFPGETSRPCGPPARCFPGETSIMAEGPGPAAPDDPAHRVAPASARRCRRPILRAGGWLHPAGSPTVW